VPYNTSWPSSPEWGGEGRKEGGKEEREN